MSNASKTKRRRLRWAIVSSVVVLIVAVGVGAMFTMRPKASVDESKVVEIKREDLAKSVVATGKIEPLAKVEVKSKASGIVKKIYAEYGDTVRAGQVLAELDKEALEARVREVRATLTASQAAAEAAEAQLERNKVDAEGPDLPFLQSSLDRARRLHETGVVAKNQLEDAERAFEMALNKRSSAQRAVTVANADFARARAQVAEAQAALDRTEDDLRNSTIVSPMNGIVLSRDVEVGDAVSSILVLGSQATLIMTLGDTSDVYVLGKVDEADIGKVFMGQPARITVESIPDKKFEGNVTKISPLGVEKDNVTTFEVRVSISNAAGELKANMSANAEIILEQRPGVVVVPESAVIYDKERNASVEMPDELAENGRRKVPVKLGISNGVKTEVLEGLDEGQKIILQ
jgi:HlyD family secretion protein